MSALILPPRFRQQPQYPARVKPEYSGGTVFVAPGYDAANGTPTALPSTLAVATTTLGKVVTNASQTSNAVVCKGGIRTANWSAVFVGSFVTGSSSYDTFAYFKDDGYALKFGNSYGGTNTFGIVVPFGGSYFSSISNRSGVPCVAAFLGTNNANYDCIVRWLDTNQVTVETGITFGGPILTAGTSYLLSEETAPYTCGANSTLALAGTIPRRMPVAEALDVVQSPWQIFKARPRFYFAPSGGSGAQTLTPGLFTNSNTFYVPTVTTGSVTLTPSLFTASQTFYAPTVTQGGAPQTLTAGLFTNSNSFFGHTLTTNYGLVASLHTNSPTFYAPVVTLDGGPQYVTPDLFTNSQSFYSPSVSVGSVTLTATLLDNTQTFYLPVVSQASGNQSITPDLFINSQAFYAPSVSGGTTFSLTAEDIAAIADAVYARFLLGAAPVNVIQFNGNPFNGTGRPGDPVTAA